MCLPLAALGTVISAGTSIVGGIQAKRQADAQAQAEQQASQQRGNVNAIQKAELEQQNRAERSQENFGIAAAGLSGTGSTANLVRQNDLSRNRDVLNVAFQGAQDSRNSSFRAGQIRQQGKSAQLGGFLDAGNTFFSSAARRANRPTRVGNSLFDGLFG